MQEDVQEAKGRHPRLLARVHELETAHRVRALASVAMLGSTC